MSLQTPDRSMLARAAAETRRRLGPAALLLLVPWSLGTFAAAAALRLMAGPAEAAPAAVAAGLEVAPAPEVAAASPPATEATGCAPDVPLDEAWVPRGAREPCPVLVAHGDVDEEPVAPAAQVAPPRDPRAEAAAVDEHLGQLYAALLEVRRNLEVVDGLAAGGPVPGDFHPLRAVELETSLLENPFVTDREAGEVDALLDEAAWLGNLERDDLLAVRAGEGGRTLEDVRFLLGAVQWYLEAAYDRARHDLADRGRTSFTGAVARALGPAAPQHVAPSFDRSKLREFSAMETYEDLLAMWD